MGRTKRIGWIAARLAALFLLAASGSAAAGDAQESGQPGVNPQISEMQKQIDEMQKKLDSLNAQGSGQTPEKKASDGPGWYGGPEKDLEEANPKKLSIGTSGAWWRPGMLLQVWYLFDHFNQDDHAPAGSGWENGVMPATNQNTFRIRRTEFNVKGEIIPNQVGFYFMIDPARLTDKLNTTPSVFSVLQDAYISYLNKYVDVSMGQFKIPVSWEGYNSSANLPFPERALVSNAYGNIRDIGIRAEKQLRWKVSNKAVEEVGFGYTVALFNGSGQNNIDFNSAKNIGLRLELYPIKGMILAGVLYNTVGEWDDPAVAHEERYEVDFRFNRWGLLLQGEWIWAYNRVLNPATKTGGSSWSGQGAYFLVGYTFIERIQPVFRIGFLDRYSGNGGLNMSKADPGLYPPECHRSYEAGINWYVKKNNEIKLQLAYGFFQYDNFVSAKKDAENRLIIVPNDNRVTFAVQVAY